MIATGMAVMRTEWGASYEYPSDRVLVASHKLARRADFIYSNWVSTKLESNMRRIIFCYLGAAILQSIVIYGHDFANENLSLDAHGLVPFAGVLTVFVYFVSIPVVPLLTLVGVLFGNLAQIWSLFLFLLTFVFALFFSGRRATHEVAKDEAGAVQEK